MKLNIKKDIFSLVLIGIIVSLFCQDILWKGMSPHRGDIPLQFYPWKAYARDMLAQGEVPYWNPYTHAGAPFMANMQSAVFYPLDLVLNFFPMERFFGLSMWLHFLLAGIGTWLLARRCGVSSLPSVLAGVAYALNGFAMIHVPAGNHLTYVGAAWAPWMFWAVSGFVLSERRRLHWGLLIAAIASMQFVCGHPQMAFYSFVFSLLFGFCLEWSQRRENVLSSFLTPFVRVFVMGVFIVFGVMLVGFQFFPTLEYFGWVSRATSLDLNAATEFSFAPHRLITLFLPDYFGTFIGGNHYDSFVYWSCAYAGVLVPVLAVCAFISKKRPTTAVPLLVVGVIALFIAWGRGNPLYAMLYQLPGFGHFRAPAKYLPFYLVPVCTLAAMGLDRLCIMAYERQQADKIKLSLGLRIAALGAFVSLIVFFALDQFEYLANVTRQLDGIKEVSMIRGMTLAYGGLMVLSGLTGYMIARKVPNYPRLALCGVMILLVSLDLFTWGKGNMDASLHSVASIRKQTYLPQEVRKVRDDDSESAPVRAATLADLYYPDLFVLWKTYNIAGYDPMSLQSYNQLIGSMEGWEEGSFHDNIQLKITDHPVYDQLNVKYILSMQALHGDGLKLTYSGKEFSVYERTSDQRSWAFSVEQSSEGKLTLSPKVHKMEGYTPHKIVFKLTCEKAEQIIVSEWYYPGWRADLMLTGNIAKKLDVVASEDGMRVLNLPKGEHRIKLYYQAPWLGWMVSFVSFCLFLFLVLLYWVTDRDGLLPKVQRFMGRDY